MKRVCICTIWVLTALTVIISTSIPSYAYVLSIDGSIDIKRMETEQMTYDLYCNPATKIFSPCPLNAAQIASIENAATEIKVPHAGSADHAKEADTANSAGTDLGCNASISSINDLATGMYRNYNPAQGRPSCVKGGALRSGDVTDYVYTVDNATNALYARFADTADSAYVLNSDLRTSVSDTTDIYQVADLNKDKKITSADVPASSYVAWAGSANNADYAMYHDKTVVCDRGDVLYNGNKVKFYENFGVVGKDVIRVTQNTPEWRRYGCDDKPPLSGSGFVWANAAYARRGVTDEVMRLGSIADTSVGGNTKVSFADNTVLYNVGSADPYGRSLQEIYKAAKNLIYIWDINNYKCTLNWTNIPYCQGYASPSNKYLYARVYGGPSAGGYSFPCSNQPGVVSFTGKNERSEYYCYSNQLPNQYCTITWDGTQYPQAQIDACVSKLNSVCSFGSMGTPASKATYLSTRFQVSRSVDSINTNYLINSVCQLSWPTAYKLFSVNYNTYNPKLDYWYYKYRDYTGYRSDRKTLK